jgi:predicted hydrocarbon binding protein
MPRTKKAETTAAQQRVVKKGEVVLSSKQYDELQNISSEITELREMTDDLGTDSSDNIKEIGYTIGRIYSKLDVLEDKLDDLLEAIDPDSSIEIEW